MKFLLYSIMFVLFSLTSHSIEKVDSTLWNYAKSAPDFESVVELFDYLIKPVSKEREKAEIFLYWIAQNIQYDIELSKKTNRSKIIICCDTVFQRKKTICSGYSNLFKDLCEWADMECVVIRGIEQKYYQSKVTSTNHAWNAVKIDGKWALVDPTWASGYVLLGGEKFVQKLNLDYFLADPKFMIIDHFPEDPAWQLLNKPISFEDFHGKDLNEMRFRKFNNLLDDDDYKAYLEIQSGSGLD